VALSIHHGDDIEFSRALYEVFRCMEDNIIVPYLEERSMLEGSNATATAGHQTNSPDCAIQAASAGQALTPAQRWRSLAQRHYCILKEHLLESYAWGWRRGLGLHVRNARWVPSLCDVYCISLALVRSCHCPCIIACSLPPHRTLF
jgi:hypothetical protein